MVKIFNNYSLIYTVLTVTVNFQSFSSTLANQDFLYLLIKQFAKRTR